MTLSFHHLKNNSIEKTTNGAHFGAKRYMEKFTAIFLTLLVLSRAVSQPSAPAQSQPSTNAPQAPPTLEALAEIIANGQGRAVYEAFNAIGKVATNSEYQEKAFKVVFPYLASDKACIVSDYHPPGYEVREKYFTYSGLAGQTIWKLGTPGRQGLMRGLVPANGISAERCALLLCDMQESALSVKGTSREKEFPELEPRARDALEKFLQQRGSSLSVYTLSRFYQAGFSAAARYIHVVLKTTKDPSTLQQAEIYLGSYGYEPALNDFLEIFKTNGAVKESFPNFTDSDRVSKAITEIMDGTQDEALKKECQAALELVHLKADWRRQYSAKTTNEPPLNPR
jgi:hypothetical protein